jgi:hypothetical protein
MTTQFGTKFVDKRRSLGRYSSLVDSGHGVISYYDSSVCLTLRIVLFMNDFNLHPKQYCLAFQIAGTKIEFQAFIAVTMSKMLCCVLSSGLITGGISSSP